VVSDPRATSGALNEAQQRVIDELGATMAERPTFADGLAVGLRERINDGLQPALALLGDDDSVVISKFMLTQVLSCEPRFLHENSRPFEWSVPVARGTVAHKAVELSVHWRTTPVAVDLVEESLSTLSHDGSPISDYLRHLPEAERAQLRSEAVNATQAFLDGFPPLRTHPHWRPAVEVRSRYELQGNRGVMMGKVDLSLGSPSGDRSGRVFIDLKTGRRAHSHRDDLRYYALIETIRYGTPPRMLASYYLDESRLSTEIVTNAVLWAAAERVVAATSRLIELTATTSAEVPAPVYRPSLACRWCSLLRTCETGTRFLDDTHEDEREILP